MRTMNLATRLLLVVAMMTAAACGAARIHNPDLQIEGKLAVYGRAVVAAASNALDSVDTITQERLRQPGADQAAVKKDAVAAADLLGQVGKYSGDLAAALAVVDAANTQTERDGALAKARNIVQILQALVVSGTVPVGDPSMRSEIARLLGNVAKALLTAAMALPAEPEQPQAVLFRPAWAIG